MIDPSRDVRIVMFAETAVAAVEHFGPPELEHETSRKLIAWRIENGLAPSCHRTYGVHYTDPFATPPSEHHVDFCVSYDGQVAPNPQGVINKIIPANRCALLRHLGPPPNAAAMYLGHEWLPLSGEALADFPIFFHYVNVGRHVLPPDSITDVYLPLR